MTHAELLKKVSPKIQLGTDYPSWDALRAVVELHTPRQFEIAPDEYKLLCSCQQIFEKYPCKTIEAIEKELM